MKSGKAPRSDSPVRALGTPEELFTRWREHHDPRAREELIRRFFPMARGLARRYVGASEPLDDLLQIASIGLVKAVDRFDPARGTAFSSFAVPTILGELKRYFRDSGWAVHVPRGTQELALRVHLAQERLLTKTGRSPTLGELAEYLELSIEDVVEALEAAGAHHATSLDVSLDDGEGEFGSLGSRFGKVDDGFELVDATATIGAAARRLTKRERRVLALRFLEDRTQSEIARLIGVSQMQVSRILRSTLDRLGELTSEQPKREQTRERIPSRPKASSA
jgi:RNA polymerase sigma-B factor